MKKKLVIDFRMHKSSGIGTYLTSLLPFIVDEFDVSLLLSEKDILLLSEEILKSVSVIPLNSSIYSISEQYYLFKKVPKCDIFWSPHYNIPLFLPQAKKRCVTIHDVCHLAFPDILSWKERLYSTLMLKCAVTLSQTILTDSLFSRSEIIKYLKPNKDVNVVYCGVDTSFKVYDYNRKIFDKYKLPQKYILFVGNVKPHKNIKGLLKAVEKMPFVNLVVVGRKDGFINSDSSVFEILNDSEQLSNRVIFTGYVDQKDLPSIYNYAEAFVFPSLYEGFGLPPTEAQQHSCPVISSDSACMPEVLEDSAVYFDARNSSDMAEKIKLVLSDQKLMDKLRDNGLKNLKRFDWELSAKKIIGLLKGE